MTKTKSKKMTKSTFAIIIMAVVMVAMLAFGGTYAYFTAQVNTLATDTVTIGKVLLAENGAASFTVEDTIVPKDIVIDGNISYTNSSTVDTYVAVVIELKIDSAPATIDQLEALGFTFTYEEANWATATETGRLVFVYTKGDSDFIVTSTDTTLNFTSADVTFDASEHSTDGVLPEDSIQGKVITMSVTAYQTQADNIGDSLTSANAVWTAMKAALGGNYTPATPAP